MPSWKLILEYDGTRYSGWQEQKNARTVAGDLRIAAAKVLGDEAEVDGAGRTDAGVHALAQVAKLKCRRLLPVGKLLRALNHELPRDINILRVEELKHSFHPRHDALQRYYLYQISTRRTAFAKKYVWWITDKLNVDAMRQVAGILIGRHDFERFCDKRGDETSTIVIVERVEIGIDGDLLLIRIGASHFLWKMVRRIVGTLVEVGRGQLVPGDVGTLLQTHALPNKLKAFSIAAHAAPASGLFLEQVLYQEGEEPRPLVSVFPVRRI